MKPETILSLLPYSEPFLFVDGIDTISDSGVSGHFVFRKDLYFYGGHFTDHPVTPGVILIECMAQIGLVCLGIYLFSKHSQTSDPVRPRVAFTESQAEFFLPVLPGERVLVQAEKVYYRMGKLKCKVKMYNLEQKIVSKAILSGMIIHQ